MSLGGDMGPNMGTTINKIACALPPPKKKKKRYYHYWGPDGEIRGPPSVTASGELCVVIHQTHVQDSNVEEKTLRSTLPQSLPREGPLLAQER
ncbi:hypothetical protein E2C01_094134 [Portunus trituberculatus]|uniref:Uncharacterized protein n=1 Tax=Portunus trituberculatus TaxID=210409 RepID=A0A5B7JWD0_PORTR|nr:hypothetical protein [Portunus trituberculatus]